MPHDGWAVEPWIDEDGECSWWLMVFGRGWRRILLVRRGECEEEGGIAVEMLDGQRHDVLL